MNTLSFAIEKPNSSIELLLRECIDFKTKPLGALGVLEDLALQIGLIQQTTTPELRNPHIIVFAGDHGIANEGVSAYPQEVTYQMVLNFLGEGAAINVFTRQHNIELTIVDAGVNHEFEKTDHPSLKTHKIGAGTKSFLHEPAMTIAECEKAIQTGSELVAELYDQGTNIIGFGEMGIGNTSAAAMIMSSLADIPIQDCVGRGTGVDDAGIQHKIEVLRAAQKKHTLDNNDPLKVLQTYGGFEIAMMCGAFLKAAELKMTLLVDGFIATSSFLCAYHLHPEIKDYAVFSHQSDEQGHGLMLKTMGASPLLNIRMRLGEGTGCAVAYPLIESAVAFLNEMASFKDAGVSNKD